MSQSLQLEKEGPVATSEDTEKVAGHSELAESQDSRLPRSFRRRLTDLISAGPIEERGILPIALEDRTCSFIPSSYFISKVYN